MLEADEEVALGNHCNRDKISAVKLDRAVIIDSVQYVQTFWKTILNKHDSINIIKENITSLEDLSKKFDIVFAACGAGLLDLWNSQEYLPLVLIRGRNLIYNLKDLDYEPKYSSILSNKYIVHHRRNHELICGATYEYQSEPDISEYEGN